MVITPVYITTSQSLKNVSPSLIPWQQVSRPCREVYITTSPFFLLPLFSLSNFPSRKEIRDNTKDLAELLARVEKATGVSGWTYDFEGDVNAFNEAVDSCMSFSSLSSLPPPFLISSNTLLAYKNRLGEIIVGSYLSKIAEMLETNMKDDMIKEAFLEAVTKKAIRFAPDMGDQKESYYQKVYIPPFLLSHYLTSNSHPNPRCTSRTEPSTSAATPRTTGVTSTM